MRKLYDVKDVLERCRITYPTLNRWLNAGLFPAPLNGRGKKLLWHPDTIEQWMCRDVTQPTQPLIGTRQQRRQAKEFQQRQVDAEAVLDRHRK